MYVYYIDMILPHLRLAGTYDKACKDYEFWEIDQRVANYYYDIVKRGFAQATVPAEDLLRRGLSAVPGQCQPEPIEILLEVGFLLARS